MSEDVVTRSYLCPIIGSGSRDNPRRPFIADLKLGSYMMHELENPQFCVVTITTTVNNHQKIVKNKQIQSLTEKNKELEKQHPDLPKQLKTALKSYVARRQKS